MQHENALKFFAKYIEAELGIVYAEHNYFQLQNRLEDIAKLMNVPGLQELHAMAQSGIWGQFKQLLLDTATNNETSFLRDPKVFAAIETFVLQRIKDGKGSPIRIWSAASSTGQEALSVAMTILECSKKANVPVSFSILGTDISERVLERAKSATYSQLEVQRGLPAPYLIKYFKKGEQDTWAASAEVTKYTEFQKLNLKDAFSFKEPFDIVLCRNVLIYQAPESKKAILAKITSVTKSDAWLILGSGESLIGLSNEYETESVSGAIIYRRKSAEVKAA
jgi:chemotaxis protein methyltransferase CheR